MSAFDDARRAYDAKTKPRGSLGRLEDLGCRLAEIRGFVPEHLEKAIVVAAGDHGVAEEGVSAYPQEVTAQMVANFAAGGAAINVLSRRAGARLHVLDRGVGSPTNNMTKGPAMTSEEVERELAAGAALVDDLDVDVVGLGEMGIANTTSASALTAALLGVDPATVCGRGTGLDDDGVARKVDAVRRALAANDGADPLTALGGFEIAFLAGVVLACERRRVAVLLD
jgi:nicotinate-nucleotide--dimethylbenzimidazole phosphoribosyltransferase